MPRRHDNLFHLIANFSALRKAARKAIKGKRKKPGAAAFMANFEREILALERQLRDSSYRPGRYVEILVRDPKERLVSAAPFRDRVVHHALCAVICPLFEPGFTDHTFANREGKGTHKAIRLYERYRDNHAHVLRADIFRYFPAIDHEILKSEFRRRIACEPTLALMDRIVGGSNRQEPVNLHFDGDDLFAPFERRRGLPIGNLTSQFFANLYLDRFDHWVVGKLGAPYVRYVDDFALFHDDPAVLADWRGQIDRFLEGRRLARISHQIVERHRPERFHSARRVAKSVWRHTVKPLNAADGPLRATRRAGPNACQAASKNLSDAPHRTAFFSFPGKRSASVTPAIW